MILEEAKNYLSDQLNIVYSSREAKFISDWILEEITGQTRSQRLVYKDKFLSNDQENTLRKYCSELLQHKPVQYVLGYADFMKMKFSVDENVLIPRPETEELVQWIIHSVPENEEKNILDIGTGSGIIPVSLKKYLPKAKLFATDISEKALAVANKNAAANATEIEFIRADILQKSEQEKFSSFDIIVSNPPYVTDSERKKMDKNVLEYEPHIALFVPDNHPLIFYEAIASFAENHLNEKGLLFFEINENFGAQTEKLLQAHHFQNIEVKKDFQGKDRMVKALFKK